MMKANRSLIIIGLIMLLAVVGVGWYLVSRDVTDTETQETRSTEETTQQEAEEMDDNTTAEVPDGVAAPIVYSDDGFSPARPSVPVGAALVIRNESSINLQFSSDPHPAHTDNSELNAPIIEPGESVTITVNEPGQWGFHNHLMETHSGMLRVQ